MEELKKEPKKQCSTCKDYRPLSEFFKEKKKPLGVQSRCKLCHAAGAKNWREQKALEDAKLAEAKTQQTQLGEPHVKRSNGVSA